MDKNVFRAFLRKNLLFLKFSWLSSLIINLACFGIIFIYLYSTFNVTTTPLVLYESKNSETLKTYFPGNNEDLIFYSPSDTFLDNLMERVRTDLSVLPERLKTFSNASSMILTLESKQKANCFAILFEEWPVLGSEESLRYTISSSMTKVSQQKKLVNDEEVNGIIDDDEYTRVGFLTLQHIIDLNFIGSLINKDNVFEVEVSPLPTNAFETVDGQRINTFGSLFVILFNILLLSTFLIPLVEEKHDGIKEFLVLATPLNFLNGLTFFGVRFLAYLPFIFGSIAVAYIYQALGLIPLTYIIVLFCLYCSAAMCYTFVISVCFNTVFYAKVGGFLLLIIPYLFHLVDVKLSDAATVIFSTTTFLEGISVMQIFTNKHRQFSAGDLFFHITNTKHNVFSIIVILLLQCLLYVLLYNYFSKIFPGKGGLKQPISFVFKPSFYKKRNHDQFVGASTGSDDNAIIIQDLVKTIATKNRVIKICDRLNMKIKNRRITVLLGHNGAGKTTTLNMIIGCIPKDSGKIIVCSERDVTFYRHLIGFCPQHSVFMQYMTCNQHLKFFAQLRGKSSEEADSLASELLTQLRLVDKANESGRNLSGGMKRRLSLGIALSGETKVVILDEPSSGLDVESRRELWDILLELRKSKAVLITTHHMEEAEILGDTISILSNGKLLQTGSPLELKRKSGSGYILKLRTDGHFDEQSILDIIRSYIPNAMIMNTVPPTVLISMPYDYKHKYTEVLEKLERKSDTLGINSIAITDTSLEDVFLNSQGTDVVDAHSCYNKEIVNMPYQNLNPGSIKWTQQVHAVFYKKMIFLKSQWIYSSVMFTLPFLTIGLTILVINSLTANPIDGGIKLNLKHLQDGYIYLKVSPDFTTVSDILKKEIERNGIQTRNLSSNLSIEEELLSIQSKNLYDFYEHAIGAIIVEPDGNIPKFRILYSGNIIHSSVIMINVIDNAILRFTGNSNGSIETTYSPIRRAIDISPSSLEYFAVIVPIGFFVYMLYYVSLPFLENRSGFKNLQAIPRTTYWMSFVAFDMVLHTIITFGCYIFQRTIMPTNLYSNEDQVLLTLTYLFYGISYLPILYCMALGFRSISPLSTYLLFMFITSAIIPFITSNNIQSMERYETGIRIMSWIPDFSFNHQLRVINENLFSRRRKVITQNYTYKNIGEEQYQPSVAIFFIYAVVLFVVVKIFLISIWDNMQKGQKLKDTLTYYACKRNGQVQQPFDEEDETLVQMEKGNVEDIIQSKAEVSFPLLVRNLHKSYGRVHSVRGISFAVKRQECFGLLGVNGAGKTSTFQMITANSPISGGNITIDGVSIDKQETLYKYLFGYCPQGDCLSNFMTSYQILKYMALLRNVRPADITSEVKYWLSQLDLSKYQNVPIRNYSGGTKRKLNAAIAMIGNPSLVLLDEPTTGVDPVSRRFLWKCIQDFQKRDKTVVLTSHSMDECEYLCNRLAIMANGKLQCIGYIPDLKEKYGSGFTINIKLSSDWSDNVISSITSALQGEFSCELREQHAGMLTFFIKDKTMKWSDVFRKMESLMNSCSSSIQDYSVNETTLEDIFLKFEKKYRNTVHGTHC